MVFGGLSFCVWGLFIGAVRGGGRLEEERGGYVWDGRSEEDV